MARLIIAGAILLVVAASLVVPFHPEAPLLALVQETTPDTPIAKRLDWLAVESGGNLAVFVLVGVAALAIVRRPLIAVLVGCALSAAGESAQILIPGRVPSWTDLLTNCVGSLIGVVLYRAVARSMARRKSSASDPDGARSESD